MSSEIQEIAADGGSARTQNTSYFLDTPCSRDQFKERFEDRVRTYLRCVYGFVDEFEWVTLEEWRLDIACSWFGRSN